MMRILDRFAADPGRADRFTIEAAGLRFDLSKLPIGGDDVAAMALAAEAADLAGWRTKLAGGAVVNPSEGRAATHLALRDPANRADFAAMKAIAERARGGAFDHLLHIGIGGSALGPALLVDALGDHGDGPACHVVSNIDGLALERAMRACVPERTLLVVVSKTFTTLETMTNAAAARNWMGEGWQERTVAVTAAPERAVAWGVPEDSVLGFAESVGGRYSLWSAVGLPLAVRCGCAAFEALLDGAHAMDRHFLEAPFDRNAPALAGAIDWRLGRKTRGVFAYDERLRLVPSWLQQLAMESNGKRVDRDGRLLERDSTAIVWGGTGTDAQHAVFQLLHQGTHDDPIEFILSKTPGHGLGGSHHRQLLLNAFAQGAALMAGKAAEDEVLGRAKDFPGDRGSMTLLLPDVDAFSLGALLAFYEARVFVEAVLLGINPFDQWGVELGKEVAKALDRGETDGFDPSTAALLRAAGLI